MNSLYSRPIILSAPSSRLRLRTSRHLPARASSTGLPSPHILRAGSGSAVHPSPCAPRLMLLPLSSINGGTIGGSKGKLPIHLGGAGCGGGGGGSGGGKPGSGDEDGNSGEGFRVLDRIVKLLRRLLQHGVFNGPLLAGDFLATMHSWVSLSTEEMQSPFGSHSSNSTHEIIRMGDDGSSDDETKVIIPVPQDNHSDRSSRISSNRNKYSTRTAEAETRTTNSQNHHVDMDISDGETLLDDEKKMKVQSRKKENQTLQSRKNKKPLLQSRKKRNQILQSRKKKEGTRSQVSNTANSLVVGALALLPYWGICCADPTQSISRIWKDALYIAYIFLFFVTIIASAHSSRYKDAKLPVNAGFNLLEIVQLLLLLFFCVAAFIPQHVCRGVSIWAICPCIGVLFTILIAFGTDFQKKTVINCIKVPCQMVIKCIKVPCQMVIKCTKVMYAKFPRRLPHLSLPECIKAKFKKVPEKQICPGLPVEPV